MMAALASCNRLLQARAIAAILVVAGGAWPSSAQAQTATTTALVSGTNPAKVGQAVLLTATVTGTSPTGTVTFKDGTTTLGTGTVSATKATYTAAFTTAGSHSLTAVYGGDANNATSTATALAETVNAAVTTTVLVSGTNPAVVGQVVTLTATVTGPSPTGTVSFKDGATVLGSGTLSAGVATYAATFLTAASHSLTAVYAGDANNATSTSTAVAETVAARTTTTTLTSGTNPGTVGQAVTLTATVVGTTPTGTVTFKDGATTLGTGTVTAGVATLATTFTTAGSHSLTAVYGGNANNLTSTSTALAETVNIRTTTAVLTSGTNPAKVGQAVLLTATITGTNPTGTVTFKDGATTLGTGTVSATKATYTATFTTAASHSLTAVYGGDANNATSTSTALVETVNAGVTTTVLASGTNPATVGQSVTLMATITGTNPTGTVTFKDGATTLGTGATSAGKATYAATFLTAASHSLTAVYAGDANNATSTSTAVTETVAARTTTTTLTSGTNPGTVGQAVTLTATVVGTTPTGTVTFKDGATTLGTGTVTAGVATLATTFITTGSHSLTAVYGGNANNLTSTSTALAETVNIRTTTTVLVSGTNSAKVGQAVLLTATITGTNPTGTVTFKDGATTLGTGTVSATKATYTATFTTAGSHSLTAVYGGDANNATSTATAVAETVNAGVTTTVLASGANPATVGQSVTLTATITGTNPTGTVTFKDGATTLGTGALSAGKATFAAVFATAGTHNLTGVYAGDTNNATSTSTALAEVLGADATVTTLASAANPGKVGQVVTLTATVTGVTPTGTVTFLDGTTTMGTGTISAGKATFAATFATSGSHSLTAVYAGNANNLTSTSAPLVETVNAGVTTTVLASGTNPGKVGVAVTLTATVTGTAVTGTVTFKDGATTLGSGSIAAAKATLAVTFATSGSHSLTAVYGGDSNNAASTSTALAETVTSAASSTVLVSSLNPAPVGQAVTLTATVSGSVPTGSVTFKDGTTVLGSAATASGVATLVKAFTTSGTHSLTAVYAGDAGNAASTSTAVSESVTADASATTLTSSVNPSITNQSIALTVSVTGFNPTGLVAFKDGTNTLFTASLSGGTVTVPTTFAIPGAHALTAYYYGNTSDAPSTSAVLNQTVLQQTSVSLSTSPTTSLVGQPTQFFASVTGVAPTGAVTFKDGATTIGTANVSGSTASLTYNFTSAGTHSLTATYAGDANNTAAASNVVSQVVNTQATSATALSATLNPALVGQSSTFTATVTGFSPTGSVTFKDGAATLGSVALTNGVANLTTSFAAAGTHGVTAVYGGDALNTTSTSALLNETVNQTVATTTLTSNINPAFVGQAVLLNAFIAGTANASGTVTFKDGTVTIGTAPVAFSVASISTTFAAAGPHSLSAIYSGDAANTAATSSPLTQNVNAQTTTTTSLASSINPTNAGDTTTLSVTVSGTSPSGSVVFKDGATTIGSVALSSGVANLSYAFAASGTHSVTASYAGDVANAPSTSSVFSQVVYAHVTTMNFTTNPSFSSTGQVTALNAYVCCTYMSGTVTFTDGGTVLGTAPIVSGASASLSTTFSTPGPHILTATYSGDAANLGSNATLTQTVKSATTAVALVSTPNPSDFGQNVTFTATVTGNSPTGTLYFTLNGAIIVTRTLSGGVANLIWTPTLGTSTWGANYAGDGTNVAASSAPLTQTVGPAKSSVVFTATPNPAFDTDSIALTATISGIGPSGNVNFRDAGAIIATVPLQQPGAPSGVSATTMTFPAGAHTLSAEYVGDTQNLPSTSTPVSLDIRTRTTTTTLAISPSPAAIGQDVVLTATIAGGFNPDGTLVQFKDGATSLGSVTVSSRVGTLHQTFTGGVHTLTAIYLGNPQNLASTSATIPERVGIPTVTLVSGVNPAALAQPVTLTATVAGTSPTGTMTFSDGPIVLGTAALSGGVARLTPTFAARGNHSITATYGGDANNAAATSGVLVEKIWTSDVALASNANPASSGQAITLTASVTGSNPSGSVAFLDGVTSLGTVPIANGLATLATSFAASGAHTLTAAYGGDANNAAATSDPVVLQVSSAAGGGAPGPMTWVYGYDALGSLTSKVDPNGNMTTLGYDRLTRPTLLTQPPPVVGGTSPVVTTSYDGQDHIASVVDPRNLTTTYAFDGLGNLGTLSSPDTGTTASTFNAASQELTRTDARGKVTTFGYDPIGRLATVTYPTGIGSVFEYDGGSTPDPSKLGHLTRITDESGNTTFTFDSLGHPLVKTQTIGMKSLVVTYGWGASGAATGKLASITYPSGARVNYAYDATGRVQALTVNPPNANGVGTNTGAYLNILSGVTYNPDGNVAGWTWANNAPYQRTFDAFGRLNGYPVGYPMGTGISSGLARTVIYDNAARITGFTHNNTGGAQAAFTQGFGYDGLDRLIQQSTAAVTYGYAYDATGNRVALVVGANTYANTVAATSNLLTNVQIAGTGGALVNKAQSYGAAGDLTGDAIATYTYSDRGRMASSTVSGNVTTYKYNALEQRVSKTGPLVPTGAAYYAYDESSVTLGEYDANLVPVAETVYLGPTPVAILKETGTAAASTIQLVVGNVYADQTDTPRVITRNSDEAVLWRWDGAEAFGNSPPQENPSGLGAYKYNQRNPGQIYDAETQNFYNVNRDYQPGTGRYAQSDPLGLVGGIATYPYVAANPLSLIDLLGLTIYKSGNVYTNVPTPGRDWLKAVTMGDDILGWEPFRPGDDSANVCTASHPGSASGTSAASPSSSSSGNETQQANPTQPAPGGWYGPGELASAQCGLAKLMDFGLGWLGIDVGETILGAKGTPSSTVDRTLKGFHWAHTIKAGYEVAGCIAQGSHH